MDLELRGRRALITGASRGIGRAVAELLAAEGCDLVLTARNAGALDGLAETLRQRHQVAAEALPADLGTDAEARRVADVAGGIDILVNNAGAIPPGNLLRVDDATWRAAWDLKVFGFISLCRAVYPGMKARGGGVIVNIIGQAGESFPPDYIAGATGNAALMALTRALGRSGPADGIRVVGINPGATATERNETMARHRAQAELGDAERWRELFRNLPFGRPAQPEEIANAVAFLASPRSGYTSGTILTINGGG